MRARAMAIASVLLACASVAIAAVPTQKRDFGQREYESNCASCHGLSGRGDGTITPFLTKGPGDLTLLARNNGGVFPSGRIWEVIDGREVIKIHGAREMPVWGQDYVAQGNAGYMDVPYDAEVYARTRMMALLDYLHRIQAR